jgi:hypothetical protein
MTIVNSVDLEHPLVVRFVSEIELLGSSSSIPAHQLFRSRLGRGVGDGCKVVSN